MGAGQAQLIEALKTRPEFKRAWEATVQGAGVNLSLRMPEPIEFAFEGLRFTAFGWMGQIYVLGEEVPPSDPRVALPKSRWPRPPRLSPPGGGRIGGNPP